MIFYSALFGLGLWLNRTNRSMLLLTLMVGGSFFLPVPNGSKLEFYATCIVAELIVACVAQALMVQASKMIIELCSVMIAAHIMAWATSGHLPLSPYKAIMFITEYLQILICIAKSEWFIRRGNLL